jgi:hypothetical protein
MPSTPVTSRVNVLSAGIALAYVGIGTLAICSAFPHDPFFGEWATWGVLSTLPVNFLSFGYRYGDAHHYGPVFGLQLLMLLPAFMLIKALVKEKLKGK